MKKFFRTLLLACLLLAQASVNAAEPRLVPGTDTKTSFPPGYIVVQPDAAQQADLDKLAAFHKKLPPYTTVPDPDLDAYNPETGTEIKIYTAVNSYTLDIFDLRLHENLFSNMSYINSFKQTMWERYNIKVGDISRYNTKPAWYAVADGTYGQGFYVHIIGTIRDQTVILVCGSGTREQKPLIDADTKKVVDNIIYLLPEPEVQMQQMRDAQGGKPLSPLAEKAAATGGLLLFLLFALYLYHEHKHSN
ncbi:MAG: hypothetical protein LKF34_07030 [Acidaminococcaceae bacterium]|jgi:hypothetical protein|nr:hypothetical protein [Acidaminococcaceae bacterium]